MFFLPNFASNKNSDENTFDPIGSCLLRAFGL